MAEAKSRRTPGKVPGFSTLNWEQARALLERFLKDNQSRYESLPAEHASTHMGGNDDVSGTTDPTTVDPGNEADPGDPSHGFAPIDHVHDVSGLVSDEELEGSLEDLDALLVRELKTASELLLRVLLEVRKLSVLYKGKL